MLGAWLGLLGAARTDCLPVGLNMMNEMIRSLGNMADSSMIKNKMVSHLSASAKMVGHLGVLAKMGFNDIATSQAKAEQIVASVESLAGPLLAGSVSPREGPYRRTCRAWAGTSTARRRGGGRDQCGQWDSSPASHASRVAQLPGPQAEATTHSQDKWRLATSHTDETKYDGLLEKDGNKVTNLDLKKEIIEVDCDADCRHYFAAVKNRQAANTHIVDKFLAVNYVNETKIICFLKKNQLDSGFIAFSVERLEKEVGAVLDFKFF